MSSSSTPTTTTSSALVKLLEACAKHRRKHDSETTNNSTNENDDTTAGGTTWCENEVSSFARVLPRIEGSVMTTRRDTSRDGYVRRSLYIRETGAMGEVEEKRRSAATSTSINQNNDDDDDDENDSIDNDDVAHLCALYRAISNESFCPNSPGRRLFVSSFVNNDDDDGDDNDEAMAAGILPRIATLLSHASTDPERMAFALMKSERGVKQRTMLRNDRTNDDVESIGSTIASLLSLFTTDDVRIAACYDLLDLSDDLGTVDDANALFDPMSFDVNDGNNLNRDNESKFDEVKGREGMTKKDDIRIAIFGRVSTMLSGMNYESSDQRLWVCVRTRRSLLAVRLAAWTALRRFVPVILATLGGEEGYGMRGDIMLKRRRQRMELVDALLLSARNTTLYSTVRSVVSPATTSPTSAVDSIMEEESLIPSSWIYSSETVQVHTLLELRMNIAIVGVLMFISKSNEDIICMSDVPSSRRIDPALMAVEAVRCQLTSRTFGDQGRAFDHSNTSNRGKWLLYQNLSASCSSALSNFVVSTVLLPDMNAATSSAYDVRSNVLPFLVDCIPIIIDCKLSDDGECLGGAVLQTIHIILSSSRPSFIEHFENRCMAMGLLSHFLRLLKESERISGPAISIVALLFQMSLPTTEDLVETSCSRVLVSDDAPNDKKSDESLIALQGSKRRKLNKEDMLEPCPVGATPQSALTHAISYALLARRRILARRDTHDEERITIGNGPEVILLVNKEDVLQLRCVTGCLRLLLSLRGDGRSRPRTDEAISRLFTCVQFVSENLIRQRIDNKLVHVEPDVLRAVLALIISIGLHTCHLPHILMSEHSSAREAISHCAILALQMSNFDDMACEINDDECSMMISKTNASRLCSGKCCRLMSMVGAMARPYADNVCLCGTDDFIFDDILPLACRSIFLAMCYPVTDHYDTTLSTIGSILVQSTRAQSPMIIRATLIGLPSLFTSLARRKGGHDADSNAKFLKIAMESFNFESHVIQYAKSKIDGIKVSAMLSLAQFVRLHAVASIVASGEDSGIDNSASVYLRQQLNPMTSEIFTSMLELWSFDKCPVVTMKDAHFYSVLGLLMSRKNASGSCFLSNNDSSQVWMASIIYLRSILAVVPVSILRSLNTLEFLLDNRRFNIYDAFMKGQDSIAGKIPNPAWILLAPFIARDVSTQAYAAKTFGSTIFCNGCKVFSAFFIPAIDTINSRETCELAVGKLFLEISALLKLCGLGQDALFFMEADAMPSHSVDACQSNVKISMQVFTSLCRSMPVKTAVGNCILERSLLSLIRIWIASEGGYAFDSEIDVSPTSHSSLASSAFDQLIAIFKLINDSSHSVELMKQVRSIMSKILCEFFLPQQDIAASIRYRLLSVFIGTFLLQLAATQIRRAFNTFEVSNAFEIVEFIDGIYPSVIVQFIKDEDHGAIQMCAAFRMYLLSEAKKLNKEEQRVQKKQLTEVIVGTRQENKRLGHLSRSLVPGVSISTAKLIENAKLLCIKTDVISYLLPQLLLYPEQAPLRFFTNTVCQSELNYPDILREIGLPVLKTLVWELGGDDPDEDIQEEMYDISLVGDKVKRKDIRLALTKGFMLRDVGASSNMQQLLMSPSDDGASDACARSWVAPNIMYLLVNIVLHQWSKRSEHDKFQAIKSLRGMLKYLPPSESPQYMPQIMSAINNAISSTMHPGQPEDSQMSKLNYIAVATLFDFLKIVISHDAAQVGQNLVYISVALFPLFESTRPRCENDMARSRAVQLLEWLASGDANESLPRYFTEIPFLPFTQDLTKVRTLLVEKGVELDDLRLMSQQTDLEADSSKVALLGSRFYNRMNTLSQLMMSHENQNVRKVVITHMTDLIQANRDLFQGLIVNEELSSMHFLTVVHDAPSKMKLFGELNTMPADEASICGGFVTKLLIRLLSRCVDESDPNIRDAIARCLGEVGAIDPNRLSKEIHSSQFAANSEGSDDSVEWRLINPPWKTNISAYQLRLVTGHLVSGLKSAPTTLDQHKISFAIQELLKILNIQLGGKNHSEMCPQLKDMLQKADVINIVEPFWTTNYKQVDTVAPRLPPFFNKATTFFSWLSSFCRFLVSQCNANKKSAWRDFFHACRSAIRSQSGIGVSEFLFPLFILDSLCFGAKADEEIIVDEFRRVLNFDDACPMNLKEREKAANSIFTVMDVLRHWLEKELELRYQPKKSSKRGSPSKDVGEFTWPLASCTDRIENFLARIPLSSCALAASKVGMRARALQFLEIDGRSRTQGTKNMDYDERGTQKFLSSDFLDGGDLKLTQMLLGQLNDFDTMMFVAQTNDRTNLTVRLAEEADEREMYEDWEGAYQAYEQLLDSRINDGNNSQLETVEEDLTIKAQKGLLRCLLKLGRLDSALNQAYGMSKIGQTEKIQISTELLPSAVEAAWRLGNWPVLDNLVNTVNDESSIDANARYQISFGRTMHSLHSKSLARVDACLIDSRASIISSLSSAARDGYSRSYPYLLQLQALNEVEFISSILSDEKENSQTSFLDIMTSKQWTKRLEVSTPDITGSSTIMNARLVLSRMENEPYIEGIMWLDIGKVARKGGLYRVSQNSFTQANVAFCKTLNLNKQARESIGKVKLQVAKLKHAVGESTTALKLVEDDIPASIFQMDDKQLQTYFSSTDAESRETIARRILQATEWMACDGLKSTQDIKDRYLTALKLAPNWERAHFNYARFLDALFETRISNPGVDRSESIMTIHECQKHLLGAVQHYGTALQLGQKHVYQALPRLLAMWLEFTSLENGNGCNQGSTQDFFIVKQGLMNELIVTLSSKIPEHLFYTALPQLISRVIHQNVDTSKLVALIIRNVLAKYPHQSMWSCGWLRFSKSEEKKRIGEEIFQAAQKLLKRNQRDKSNQNLLNASKSLFQFFITLAQFMPKGTHSAVKMKVPTFDTELRNFIPPIQAALSLCPGALEGSVSADVFPSFVPRMRAFNPEIKIMQSKAKPKKVSIYAASSTVASRNTLPTDGRALPEDVGEMHFLVKQEAKGDLRKDSRVQDLNNVINRLLASRKGSSGPNSRRRRLRLQLRTFSVVCLAEDCGILEWVPNTESLRSVITGTYNPQIAPDSAHRWGRRITNFADPELRDTFSKCQDVYFKKGDLDLATKKFDELILKQYLPVMYWWFIQNFSSPHAWYQARSNFTLSTAVWSAVGHIIGLGDRHSENILIDTKSGECVHVDFDCIFDKGLILPKPEVIPFRLTPNMLDAFGPAGANGMFSGALTESMRTLRKNRDTLLSVLEPFLNDPVINFKSKSQKKSKDDKGVKDAEEIKRVTAKDAEEARKVIANIEGRLNGEYNLINPNIKKMNKDTAITSEPVHFTKLSVEGQVQRMIMEATSKDNLVQVYVGWMPWI